MTSSELIQNLDCEALLVNISKGMKLNESEIESIKDFLNYSKKLPRQKVPLEDLYSAVTVLAKANDPKNSFLVEQFLDYQDSLIACLALETLVCNWNNFEEILEKIFQFALGTSWDKDQDLRISALNCLTYIAVNHKDRIGEDFKNKCITLINELKKEKNLDELAADASTELSDSLSI